MPIKIRPELAALAAHAKARPGFFSVLDELVQQMPDRPMTPEEIRQRLKPNTMLQREGMRFPLKQDEITYALDPVLNNTNWDTTFTQGRMSPRDLLSRVRRDRPEFSSIDTKEGSLPMNFQDFSEYSTRGPNRLPDYGEKGPGYFESITESPDFGETMGSHFTPNTLMFTRGSRHQVEPQQGSGILRIIDEIQNDRANEARSHAHAFDADRGDAPFVEGQIKGWATPEEAADFNALIAKTRQSKRVAAHAFNDYGLMDWEGNELTPPNGVARYPTHAEAQRALEEHWPEDARDDPHGRAQLIREHPAAQKPQDMPFKDPQDYGRFEIKNQILDALHEGDEYLGITPPAGPSSWFPGTGKKDVTYGNVYPGELRKIARQYDTPSMKVPVDVTMADPLNLDTLAGTDIVDFINTTDWHRGEPFDSYSSLIDELATKFKGDPDFDPRSGGTDALEEASNALERVRELENNLDLAGNPVHPSGQPRVDIDIDREELTQARNELEASVQALYEETRDQNWKSTSKSTRDIPSMHLTPDFAEKVGRIGLPLFTAAGAAALSPELMQSNESPEAPVQEFAGGGIVSRAVGALHKISDADKGFKQKRLGNLSNTYAELMNKRFSLHRQIAAAERGDVPADLNKLEDELHTVNGQLDEVNGMAQENPHNFAGGGSVLGRISGALERGARSSDLRWERELQARMAERDAMRPGRRGRSETLGDYGAYMARRGGEKDAQPMPMRATAEPAPILSPVDEDALLRDLPAPDDHAGTGHWSDMGALERFRRYLGLARGGSVEGYADGGPVGYAPPQPATGLPGWATPQAPQPGNNIVQGDQQSWGQLPWMNPQQPIYAPPQQGGGMLKNIAGSMLQSGATGAIEGGLTSGTLAGAGQGALSGLTGGVLGGGAPATAGTGILSSIGSGMSSLGSSIYGGLAAMGPVGWAGAAALALGTAVAASQPKSSPLNHFDTKTGGWSKGENFAGQKYSPEQLNAYYGPALAKFKETGGDVHAAMAALPPPQNPQEKALYDGRNHLFDGSGNPMRQIAMENDFGKGAWSKGTKEKKALLTEMGMDKNSKKAAKQAAKNPAAAPAFNAPRVGDLANLRQQAVATNAAAPTELSRLQPQTPRVTPGANKNGLLSQIKQQQAMRSPG